MQLALIEIPLRIVAYFEAMLRELKHIKLVDIRKQFMDPDLN